LKNRQIPLLSSILSPIVRRFAFAYLEANRFLLRWGKG
jgi:hypothetical protein